MRQLRGLALAAILVATLAVAYGVSAIAAEKIKMATIAPGSSAYLVMTAMASAVNAAQDDYDISVDATGAATKHMVEAAKGQLDIIMSSPNVMDFMQKGIAMYKKLANAPELAKNLGLIYWFPYGSYHTVVYADSGIRSLADLKGKKVFLGPPGGGAWSTAKRWVQATTGMEPNKDYKNVKASWSAGLQGFQDRQFDAYVVGGIPPFPQIEQLALTAKIRIIGLSKQEYDAISGEERIKRMTTGMGRSQEIISKDAYGGGVVNTEDVYTIGAMVGVVARMDLAADAVYTITKAFWEALPGIQKNLPFMKRINLTDAISTDNMKLHPGALRYYEELKLDISDNFR